MQVSFADGQAFSVRTQNFSKLSIYVLLLLDNSGRCINSFEANMQSGEFLLVRSRVFNL